MTTEQHINTFLELYPNWSLDWKWIGISIFEEIATETGMDCGFMIVGCLDLAEAWQAVYDYGDKIGLDAL